MEKEEFLEYFELEVPKTLKDFVVSLEKIASGYADTKMAKHQMYDYSVFFPNLMKEFASKLNITTREDYFKKLINIKKRARKGIKAGQKSQARDAGFEIMWDYLLQQAKMNESRSFKLKSLLNEILEPKVYYHGSYNDFDTFKNKMGTHSSFDYENPIFLSTDIEFAKEYAKSKGGILYTVKVDSSTNIFDFRLLPTGADLDTFNRTDQNPDSSHDYDLGNLVDELLMDEDRTEDYYYFLRGDYGVMEQTYFMEFLKKNKFDGAFVMETDTLNLYIFNPAHIKIIKKDYIN